MEKYMTPEQIAEVLLVPVARVGYWLRNGRLRGIKVGKVWRIPESALISFLDQPKVAVNE